jgi:hypothetical protein
VRQFQRAFLEATVLNLTAPATAPALTHLQSSTQTGEPTYSPKPGVFDGDTEVALPCDAPRAKIHFTVDSSQPDDSSPLYASPIVVKGTELTIKAFASVPGQRDSPVVTGIFRILE